MLRSLKVATPPEAFLVLVPFRTPYGGLAIAIVMGAADEVTVFPRLSRTTTVGPGSMVTRMVMFQASPEVQVRTNQGC